MVSTAYKYLSDDGNTYQVVLPSDFASALSYVAATGSEPYIPTWISYRYATYQTSGGLFLSGVVVTEPFAVGNPPSTITVDGVVYLLKSQYGEQRGITPNNGVLLIAGPQGPPGSGGGGDVTSVSAGTGISVSPSTGAVVVTNTGVLAVAAGTGISVSESAGTVTVTNTGTSSSGFTSAQVAAPGANTNTVFAHGLGRVPKNFDAFLVCETAENGFAAGDIVKVTSAYSYLGSGAAWLGCAARANSVDVIFTVGNEGIVVLSPTGFDGAYITLANWKLFVTAT